MNKKRYFTLIELITAITVAGFIALIVGTASATFYNSWRISVQQTNKLRQYQKIDVVMDSCVRNMVPFNWTDEDNDTASDLLFDGETDRIFFTALRRNYSQGAGALLFIRIRIDEEDNLIAEYSEYPRFPWVTEGEEDPDMPYTREVLAEQVESVTFLYAEKRSDLSVEWLEEWDREEDPYLPLAVRMTIRWLDGTEESWLRRTAGSGSNSVYGDREEVMGNAQNGTQTQTR